MKSMRVILGGFMSLLIVTGALQAQQAFQITTASPLPNGTVGVAYSLQLAATAGFRTPYVWSTTSTLPSGLTLSSSGLLSGTPTAAFSTANLLINVSEQPSQVAATQTARKQFALTISLAPLTITTSSLASGSVSTAYSQAVTATGGLTPYTWSATGLPGGLGINSRTGTISGTPTQAGTFAVTITVVDSASPQDSDSSRFTLVIGAPLTITTTSLVTGSANAAYSQAVTATGGQTPYTWSATGLPTGLTIGASSGTISGTPTQSGSFMVTITVVDSASPQHSASMQYTLVIDSNLRITTSTIATPMVGVQYSQTLAANGGVTPYMWTISAGFLPPGLSLDSVAGTIMGTPSIANAYNFTAKVTDAQQSTATQQFMGTTITPITFVTANLGNGVIGATYSQQINATGGAPPLAFTSTSVPPGLKLSSTGGVTGTPTTAGSYSMVVVVTDSLSNTASKTYPVTVTAAQPPLQVSPTSLTFTASSAGAPPPAQIVTVLSSGAAGFTLTLDSGQANTAAPSWLNVTPLAGTTPGIVTVSVDPSSLSAGSFSGRIIISGMDTAVPTIVPVALTVAAAPQTLAIGPAFLRYPARSQSPGLQDRYVVVRNDGGSGALSFSVTTPNPIPWLDSVTPNSGTAAPNAPAFVRVRINTSGLAVGGYKGSLQLTSGTTVIDIPLSVFVSPPGPILDVDETGFRFQARQGQPVSAVKTLEVLNDGDPGTTVNFTATVANSAPWLTISPTTGTATPTQPGAIQLSINSNETSLAIGGYYALVEITDANSHNSPQYVVVVLDVGDDTTRQPAPDPFPAGLVFTGGGTETFNVGVSSSTPVNFTAAAVTNDGATWLSVSPASGTVSGTSAVNFSVTTNTTGLKAGVYTGLVNIAIADEVRGISITLIVPAGTAAAAEKPRPNTTAACTPTEVVLTQTGLPTNFNVPAGWPEALSVAMNDDCGNPLSTGSVSASFTNGDPPLSLRPTTPGIYSATWQPGNPTAGLTITVRGSYETLQPGSTEITGGVTPNAAPVLFANGTVNNYFAASSLSPGLIAQVYGSGLAGGMGQPNALPLPGTFQGTSVIVGGASAPIYYVSPGQVNVELPAELTTSQQVILVSVNNAFTLPDLLDINPFQAGIAAYSDGSNNVIAQHADYSYVTSASPAKPGEVVIIYLAGMGATNPAVASGQGAPTTAPLAQVVSMPTVTVGGQNATVEFAGLAPGFVGLYQIDLMVPATASAGSLPLVVSQNGVVGNTTNLIVGQ